MKRLFKSLCELYDTELLGEILERAEFAQSTIRASDDFIKFFYKTKELLISSIPDEFTLQQDLNFRAVFKIIVRIVDN